MQLQGKLQVFPLFGREVFQEVLEELDVEVTGPCPVSLLNKVYSDILR